MSRVLCRQGVPRGTYSATFTVEDLLDALHAGDDQYVYATVEGGELRAAGGAARGAGGAARGAGGAARLAVSARLAPSLPARSAALVRVGALLAVRTERALAPHDELLLWFEARALPVPFLTPRDVRAHPREPYACRRCGAAFADPNPLKLHLFLRCRPFEPRAFWREAAARAREEPPPAPASAPPAPAPSAAELEALAAEWGRSRAGHACVYCGRVYSRRYGLRIHLRTHTGYRPLRCPHCLRAFADPSNLNKHVRLHERAGGAGGAGGARYTCAVCGRALARRRDLQRHERAHARVAAGVGVGEGE